MVRDMSVTRYEQETIINYNQEEKTASVYTHDPSLMRKLDAAIENGETVILKREGDGWKEYEIPKKFVKVRFPRKLSDEQREEMALRMRGLRKENTDG